MLPTDSLRKVLFSKAITAVTALNLKCRIGEEDFVEPQNEIYGEFWFRVAKPYQMELGSRSSFECAPGVLQFTLYAPESSGDGPILKLGDQLKNMINRQQWKVAPDGYVSLEPAGCEEIPGIKMSKKIVIVDCGFDFYYRDPNPNTILSDF